MKLSKLASDLWPFLRNNVEQAITNGAASRSGGGGGLTVHTLSGAYHSGTLDDSQAPQFLKTDGTRALTGNLTVNSGITIDGVDISDHAAATGSSVHGLGTISTQNANSVAITGGSITGITDIAIADGGTGASTAANARTNLGLAIGTNVQAWDADLDAIAALAKSDGNFIVGNGTTWVAESGNTARTSLSLGTSNSPTFAGLTINGNITVTGTVDGVDVSDHSARHESGGADTIDHDLLTGFVADEHVAHSGVTLTAGNGLTGGGTIAASRSFAVGAGNGITVNADDVAVNQAYAFTWTAAHEFREDVQVFNPSDLTTPVFYVDQSAYAVGINRDPDIQFSLDVAGALRADWLVGPHAIQLSDAELICHFDGPGPYETDFTGTPQGHKGQVATVSGGVEYHEGKFGKALQIGNTTTNLVVNPSFESFTPGTPDNFTGWTEVAGGGTVQAVASEILGSYACRLTYPSAGATNYVSQSIAVSPSTQYTLSFYLTVDDGAMYYRVDGNVSGSGGIVPTTYISTPGTQRVIVTFTTGASDTSLSLFFVRSGNDVDFTIDAVQLEQRAFATAFVDGSRTGGTLYHDISNIDANEGTIMMWVKQDSINTAGGFLWSAGNANAEFDCYVSSASGGILYFRQNVVTSTNYNVSALIGQWYHVACTWSVTDNYHALYVNGVLRDSGTYSAADLGSGVYIGKTYSGVTNNHTGLIDEFALLSRAADADEIRAIYESNAPVFAESATNFFKSYGPTPVEINEEGLFVSSVTTGDIFAVYGGGATKSWGGLTLGDGDVLIGRSTDGYVHWDDSADLLDISGQVEITGSSIISGTLAVTSGAFTRFFVTQDYLVSGGNAGADVTSFALIFEDSTAVGTDPMSPTYDAGDVLIGDELNANVLWDQSAGQLLFRDTSTTKLYIDTDGSLKGGAGAVTLDETGFRLAVGTGTPNRIRWMNSATERSSINGFDSGGTATVSILAGQNVSTAYPGAISLTASEGGGSLGFASLSLDGSGNAAYFQFDDDDARFRVQKTGPTTWFEVAPTDAVFGGSLTLPEMSSTPATPTSGTQARVYMKADKLVFQYNDGGTVRYKYISLSGTSVTWTHTTTAP